MLAYHLARIVQPWLHRFSTGQPGNSITRKPRKVGVHRAIFASYASVYSFVHVRVRVQPTVNHPPFWAL